MLVSDILRSCAHRHVAAAAIMSIGGDFAASVQRRAEGEGLSLGDFAADRVKRFPRRASEGDWRMVEARMQGQDLALLSGLEVVMMRMMADDSAAEAKDRA